jgi:hypothetical protein
LEEEKETEMRKKSPKTKAKKGKFKQQKKKDIEEGDEGPTPPELEEKAKHNGKGKKSKDDNKKEPPLTTALVPNGNELLVQLKDVTKWLLEKSSQPKKSKKTKTPSEEEKEGEKEASVWTTRDKRLKRGTIFSFRMTFSPLLVLFILYAILNRINEINFN